MLDVYWKIKNINLKSGIFFYNGTIIAEDDYKKTVGQIANKFSKREKSLLF